jgi:hypothetical protein
MLMLKSIEQEVAEQLYGLQEPEKLKVILFPESGDELQRPPCDRIIVGFGRESLSPPSTRSFSSPIIQERELQFGVYVQIRDLRGRKQSNPRLLDLLDLIRDALTGFHPVSANGGQWLYQTTGGFVEFGQGFWLYSANFTLPVPYQKKR